MHLLIATADQVAVIPLDTVGIATLVSFFVPLLVSLVTKHTASDGLRAVVNVVATAVVSVVALFASPSPGLHVTWVLALNTFVASLVTSFTAYKAVWKPTGAAGTITRLTANFGLSSPPVLETKDKGVENLGQIDSDPRH